MIILVPKQNLSDFFVFGFKQIRRGNTLHEVFKWRKNVRSTSDTSLRCALFGLARSASNRSLWIWKKLRPLDLTNRLAIFIELKISVETERLFIYNRRNAKTMRGNFAYRKALGQICPLAVISLLLFRLRPCKRLIQSGKYLNYKLYILNGIKIAYAVSKYNL